MAKRKKHKWVYLLSYLSLPIPGWSLNYRADVFMKLMKRQSNQTKRLCTHHDHISDRGTSDWAVFFGFSRHSHQNKVSVSDLCKPCLCLFVSVISVFYCVYHELMGRGLSEGHSAAVSVPQVLFVLACFTIASCLIKAPAQNSPLTKCVSYFSGKIWMHQYAIDSAVCLKS